MNYKVCILTAGIGSRMGGYSSYINKAILPIKNKPIISHIIEKFPEKIEIVIAIGHQKNTVTDYLCLAYPKRKFTFVEVNKYKGPGTGPGYSLLQCKKQLQCPFIFYTADTLVSEKIPNPDYNWFGIATVKETESYITVNIKNNLICQLDVKTKNDNKFAFIGLAGIKDYKIFFDSLKNDKTMIDGEIQVSNGFKGLIEHQLNPAEFTWFDTGTLEKYRQTNKHFAENGAYDFSKEGEFIYFVNERVIKFFADKKIVKNRHKRAIQYLKGLCPKIEGCKGNFYSYKKINGKILYDLLGPKTVRNFLQWAQLNLWKMVKNNTKNSKNEFKKKCKEFYFNKTIKRLNEFYKKTGIIDCGNTINGVSIPKLRELLEKIDWDYIAEGIPSNFHGDLQFDNILVTGNDVKNPERFTLLDWRQDFGGALDRGDLYYDLAKLYSGTIVPFHLIKDGMFSLKTRGSRVYYNFYLKNDLVEAKEEYELFIERNKYDLKKIKIITALIFLNLSPMFKNPFNLMAYYLGKNMLNKTLSQAPCLQHNA